MTRKEKLMVNIPSSAYQKLKQLSERTGNSMNSYIREGIVQFLEKKEILSLDESTEKLGVRSDKDD